MASSKFLLSTLLLFLTIASNSPATTLAQECPYPCYPPPTGTGSQPGQTTTTPTALLPPPVPQTGGASQSPPTFNAPPTAGGLPNYNPSPPNFDFGGAPPPPDHMVPWFPYYSRKPLYPDANAATSLPSSAATSTGIIFLLLIIIHLVL